MWFPFALLTAIFWGGSDLFSKMGTNPKDKYSHLKIIVFVGGVMGIFGIVLLIINWSVFDPMSMLKYLPIAALYIGAMYLGYIGLRYIELSVSSPVCNSSGAIAAIFCFVFLGQTMEMIQVFAVICIIAGVILLSVFDLEDENKARRFRGELIEDKYRVSFIAIMLPVFYAILDALGTFGEVILLEGDAPIVSEMDAEISYYLIFLIFAILTYCYLVFVKKQKISIKEEREKGLGAISESLGQFFYIQALADSNGENAIKAAPLISAYCLFSVILSRIFLKEKLTKRQYGAVALAIAGIIVMGFFDA